jgi:hypothetical protein
MNGGLKIGIILGCYAVPPSSHHNRQAWGLPLDFIMCLYVRPYQPFVIGIYGGVHLTIIMGWYMGH